MNILAFKKQSLALLLVAGALIGGSLVASPARAQIDIGDRSFGIYEDGVLVGEIFREGEDPSSYVEHWVMYPGYVYPSEQNGVHLDIRPGLRAYGSATEFLATVPFERGARYARTVVSDLDHIPGR